MQKIDRLGWTAGFSFLAYGIRVGVRSNSIEILNQLRERRPFSWKLISSPDVQTIYSLKIGQQPNRRGLKQFHLIYANFENIGRTLDIDQAIALFEQDIQLYVAENALRRVFVHAGVVGWNNQAILIPGRSLSGKSTLVRELIKAGAIYYSDEYAVLDLLGRVHPYPTPIGVRKNLQEQQEKYPINTFGGVSGTKPLPVGLVLTTEYKQGTRWRPKQVPSGQGLLAILANTVSAQRNPTKALATLQQVVLKAPVLKGVRGETDEVVDALLNRPWPTL